MNNALNQKAFWILTAGSLMLAITLGIRHAFGVFLVPMSIDNGWADKLGAKPVMLVGGRPLWYGDRSFLYFLIGIGLAGTTFPVIFGAISRVVPAEKRSFALGVSMSIGSLGQFVLLPLHCASLSRLELQLNDALCVELIHPTSIYFQRSSTKNVTHSTPGSLFVSSLR
jgi:hypothetical protein